MKKNGRGAPSMTAAELAACLAVLKPRFLAGLTPRESSSIVAAATMRQFSANSVMASQGYPPDRLFLLLSGRARLFFTTEDGRKFLLLWVPPGEVCGGAALVSRADYLVSTEAVEDTYALVWDRKTIRHLAERYPRLLENSLLIAFDYLVLYRTAHVSLTCHTARQRLAQVLSNLATGIGKKVPGGIELNVRNEELANEANVTLFTASRLLNEWQRMGIVEKSRGKVLVCSPERLSSRSV